MGNYCGKNELTKAPIFGMKKIEEDIMYIFGGITGVIEGGKLVL